MKRCDKIRNSKLVFDDVYLARMAFFDTDHIGRSHRDNGITKECEKAVEQMKQKK